MLGETLRQREGAALSRPSSACARCRRAAAPAATAISTRVAELLRELPVESAVPVARAFSHFLTLANIAEQHHRVRRRRDYQHDPSARRHSAGPARRRSRG